MYARNEKIVPIHIEDEMKDSYISYAMSVIVGRALPDARDGLKPVHRRILYGMKELGLEHTKPYKKCARITGEVLGKYHPHGDVAVYDTLVRMVQDFSLRYPLVEGQGNFGSVDGDAPAAMRYCVTGDTLIFTEKGIMSIKDISNKKECPINFMVLNYSGKKIRASKFFNSDEHPTLKVTTEQGYEIKGSYNHPLLCWVMENGGKPALKWKTLEEIKEDDILIINRKHFLFNRRELNLKRYFPTSIKYKEITLPKKMNKDLAFLLGALVSEGSFHQSQIIFNNSDREFYNRIKRIIEKEFEGVSLYERNIKGDCRELSIYHQKVVEFLKNLGLRQGRSDSREIPFSILLSKEECVSEFLKGLFEGDGSVSYKVDKRHKGRSIELVYNSKSKKLIQQLKILLLNFGIVTTSPFVDKRNGCYKLLISGQENIRIFQKKIDFFSAKKKSRLLKVNEINFYRMSKTDYIPYLNDYLREKYNNGFVTKYNLDRYNNIGKYYKKLVTLINKDDKRLMDWLLANRYFFNRVKSIEKLEAQPVYSVKVESNCHSFIANGFVNHNTEARLAPIADEMLADLEKDTVDFMPNFDASLQEPVILPATLPNLLVNGSSGIAVGMATNIPPHNLSETVDGIMAVIDDSDISIKDLMKIIKAPDFPTGGIICGREGIKRAYTTGRGLLKIRARAGIESHKSGKESIIITEIPYQVNKANLIESIAQLVQDKKVEGIADIRDESDKEGLRVVIELKRDANAQVILNQLFKHTQLEVSFGVIMLALDDKRPRVLSLKQILECYIDHRKDVVTRRTRFELKRAQERAHILEGLKKALANLDKVIETIKKSKSVPEAKEALVKKFDLTEVQAQAILEMQLQRLTALEREKIEEEYLDLIKKIELYESILKNEKKILQIIKDELLKLKEKYGDERRTDVVGEVEELEIEDLIAEEDVVITISHSGYIKRLPVSGYRRQRRGGKGVMGAELKEEDFVEYLFIASTHEYILFFTNQGRVHWLKVYDIPQAGKQAKGKAIINLLELQQGETISAFVPVKEFKEGNFLIMTTKQGVVKKTSLEAYSRPRKGGIIGITLEKGDELIGVVPTDGKKEILLATREGKAIRFPESQVRNMGRSAKGVKGISLGKKDEVIAMEVVSPDATVLTVTSLGFGKRTLFKEYRTQSRGGKGIINIKVTKKNGEAVGLRAVADKDEIMLITERGVIVRCPVKDIRSTGRAVQGVRVIKLDAKDKVTSVALVVAEEEGEEGEDEK